ncbi:MAG: hypothetical protein IJQ21_12795 [Lachnospiraceae bacterium]|nr:hypothetical protein [Lachnospiraceae bacterium]
MYYFRADANEQIGMGHMMRCLTIAQALAARREPVVFLCADDDSAKLPQKQGFRTIVLRSDYQNMESELPGLSVILADNARVKAEERKKRHPGALVSKSAERPVILVDSYFVTDSYLAVLRAFGKVVLIDDNMERSWPVDRVLNYNFHADPEAYAALYGSDGTRFFTGPFFAPVRQQFANRDYRVMQDVKCVLVLSGGSDPDNAAGEIYKTLRGEAVLAEASAGYADRNDSGAGCLPADTEIVVVCGHYNVHAKDLEACAKKDARLRVLYDVEDMAAVMCECDLAVSACGSTTYELCAVGLPFVCYALADNQLPLAAYIDVNGPAPYAGDYRKHRAYTLSCIAEQVRRLAGDHAARAAQSIAQRKLVDGKGAAHIAAQVLR